ncbi:MAG: hypothetical protein ACKOYN_05545 [Planctomycetota bacterium]
MTRTNLAAALLASAIPCAAVTMTAAQSSSGPRPASSAPAAPKPSGERAAGETSAALPDGAAVVRRAKEALGGDAWGRIKSFESSARVKSAMGDARIEYRFVAPDSFELLQSMPGCGRAMSMGCAKGAAWIGEAGSERAADPRMAEEMRDGGDLHALVRTLSERFSGFRTEARREEAGRDGAPRAVLVVRMRPARGAAPNAPEWTLLVDEATGLPHGLEIPAPPAPAGSSQKTFGQSIRFARWEAVSGTKEPLRAFREAAVTSGGTKTDIVYEKVAVDALPDGAVQVPAALGRAR